MIFSRSSSITGKREWPLSTTVLSSVSPSSVAIEHGHLRARHHDVAHLDVGDAEHAFEHHERIAFDDLAQRGLAQVLDDFAAILRFAADLARQLAQPAAAGADVALLFLVLLFVLGVHR